MLFYFLFIGIVVGFLWGTQWLVKKLGFKEKSLFFLLTALTLPMVAGLLFSISLLLQDSNSWFNYFWQNRWLAYPSCFLIIFLTMAGGARWTYQEKWPKILIMAFLATLLLSLFFVTLFYGFGYIIEFFYFLSQY